MITSTDYPSKTLKLFMRDLRTVVPNSFLRSRRKIPLHQFADKAAKFGFTDLVVVNEDQAKPSRWQQVASGVGVE